MADFKNMAKEILNCIGGVDNIKEMSHCMTRLRLNLKDDAKVKKNELEKIEGCRHRWTISSRIGWNCR